MVSECVWSQHRRFLSHHLAVPAVPLADPCCKVPGVLAHQPGWEGGTDLMAAGGGRAGSSGTTLCTALLCGSGLPAIPHSKMPSDVQGFILQDAVAKMC